jgi:hypothetical protein
MRCFHWSWLTTTKCRREELSTALYVHKKILRNYTVRRRRHVYSDISCSMFMSDIKTSTLDIYISVHSILALYLSVTLHIFISIASCAQQNIEEHSPWVNEMYINKWYIVHTNTMSKIFSGFFAHRRMLRDDNTNEFHHIPFVIEIYIWDIITILLLTSNLCSKAYQEFTKRREMED